MHNKKLTLEFYIQSNVTESYTKIENFLSLARVQSSTFIIVTLHIFKNKVDRYILRVNSMKP